MHACIGSNGDEKFTYFPFLDFILLDFPSKSPSVYGIIFLYVNDYKRIFTETDRFNLKNRLMIKCELLDVAYSGGLDRNRKYSRKYINAMFPRQDRNWSTIPWITNIIIITTASIPANNAPKNITLDDFRSHPDTSSPK